MKYFRMKRFATLLGTSVAGAVAVSFLLSGCSETSPPTATPAPPTATPAPPTATPAPPTATPAPPTATPAPPTATPAPAQMYQLIIVVDDGGTLDRDTFGSDCSSSCSDQFTQGSQVRIDADTDSGWDFDRWEVVNGSTPNSFDADDEDHTITLTGDVTLRLRFREEPTPAPVQMYQLTVIVDNGGVLGDYTFGSDCSSSCSDQFTQGSQVRIGANADSGWDFDKWEVVSGSTPNSFDADDEDHTITLTGDVTLRLRFRKFLTCSNSLVSSVEWENSRIVVKGTNRHAKVHFREPCVGGEIIYRIEEEAGTGNWNTPVLGYHAIGNGYHDESIRSSNEHDSWVIIDAFRYEGSILCNYRIVVGTHVAPIRVACLT